MSNYSFVKMTGAGNDFVIIDLNANSRFNLDSETVKRICNRRNGIGADGLITISEMQGYDFNMNYYNSDGSTGSLCGNGARCAIRYAQLFKNINPGNIKFISNGADYTGTISENEVTFNLNEPSGIKMNFIIKADGKEFNASFIDTGSPHVVINIDETDQKEINSFPVVSLGREIRYLNEFAPGGANVNFIKIAGDKLIIRTFERGVEDETLACGTGSAAAAVISCLNYGLKPPVKLITRGGDVLLVNFNIDGQKINALTLNGPVKVVFEGQFTEKLIF